MEQPLFQILDLSQYKCYLRVEDFTPTTSGKRTIYGSKELIDKVVKHFGDNTVKKIFDLNGDGAINIMDMISASSNFGRENNEIDLGKIIVTNQYSSHYEYYYEPTLYIDGEPHENITGFISKTQGDEVSVNPEFNSIDILVVSWSIDKEGDKVWKQDKYYYLNTEL